MSASRIRCCVCLAWGTMRSAGSLRGAWHPGHPRQRRREKWEMSVPFQRGVLPIVLGLATLLVLAPAQAESDAKTHAGWARVQSLPPGKPTRLILFQSQAAPRARKLKGAFHAATDSSLTLLLNSGETRTFARQTIRLVRVSRPARRRYAWIPGTAAFAVVVAIMQSHPGAGDWIPSARVSIPALYSAPAWALSYLLMPATRVVYRAPKTPRATPQRPEARR